MTHKIGTVSIKHWLIDIGNETGSRPMS